MARKSQRRMTEKPEDCILETERLWLCRMDPERDFRQFSETMADADTMRFIGGAPMSEPQAWRSMATIIGHWDIRGYGFMSCIAKDGSGHVGRIGPWYPHGWPDREVGWTLHPAFQGMGYATEAGRACIDYAFGELGWNRVIHVIQHGNHASANVARKLGSTHIGEVDGIPAVTEEACWIYGQDKP